MSRTSTAFGIGQALSQSHDVLLITSNFRHYDKSFRRPEHAEAASKGRLKVRADERERLFEKRVARALEKPRCVCERFRAMAAKLPTGRTRCGAFRLSPDCHQSSLGEHKERLGYKLIIDVQTCGQNRFPPFCPC